MNLRLRLFIAFGIPAIVPLILVASAYHFAYQAMEHRADQASKEAKPDRVTYASFQPGNWHIYQFTQLGQTPLRLTTDLSLEYDPTVSPDGRWLVFCSERSGTPHLYVLDLQHGGTPRLLIESEGMEDQAAFSPDSKSIAFVSTFSGNADIYMLPFRSDKMLSIKDAENLTRNPSGNFRPAFSPDGRKLTFSSDRDLPVHAVSAIIRLRSGDIYVMDLATKKVQRLTNAPGWDGSPAWSLDGKTIAFYSQRDTGPTTFDRKPVILTKIWAMNADGSNQHAVTPNETTALSPEFLPNGRMAYSRKTRLGARRFGTGGRAHG